MTGIGDPVERLRRERHRATVQLTRLVRDREAIIDQVRLDAPDDEHDPDGATLGWEREQLTALIALEQRRVTDIDDALAAVSAGTYGCCTTCGRQIGSQRLEARPAARHCITCAT